MMSMSLLPKELTPNPLLISAVEIRFSSKIDENSLLTKILSSFSIELPKFSTGKIPKEIKIKEEQFKYAADYILSNDTYSLSFSNNVMLFEIVGEYPFWNNYYEFIKKQINIFFALDIIDKIERIGVRYASLLDSNENLSVVIKHNSLLSLDGYDENIVLFRVDLKKNNYNFHIQIIKNAKADSQKISKIGLFVDIDASYTSTILPNDDILRIINELHQEEKSIFFSMLKPDFLTSLNPKY